MAGGEEHTREAWIALYDVWDRVGALAPWRWMSETQVFGVEDPVTGELGFVSVMGELGEHLAVALYPGAPALSRFWMIQMMPDNPTDILLIPQLQASFEDRNMLTDRDRAQIKELGRKYRGKQAWPSFRSYRPSYYPWYLEADEVRSLTVALEQLLEVAPRARTQPDVLGDPAHDRYLVRVPRRTGDTLVWEEEIRAVSMVPPTTRLNMPMNTEVLNYVKGLPQSRVRLEIDLFMLRITIKGEGDGRPYFPHMLLMVDADSGFIFGWRMLSPAGSLESIYEQVPLATVEELAKAHLHPARFVVRRGPLGQLLERLARELGARLAVRTHLPAVDEAKEAMPRRFGPV